MEKNNKILDVKGIKKYFPIKSSFLKRTIGYVRAVDDVDLYVRQGETLGLVGESGCGKTTIGRCILRAIEPTSGQILFRNSKDEMVEVNNLTYNALQTLRRDMQMIFQDPYSSLNPRMIVQDIIAEPLICNTQLKRNEIKDRVKELVDLVGLNNRHLERYPHAFSGGQRQRIGIARALATNPRFIVCDEAVSALDVSVQAQILNLLQELQNRLNLSYLFISHDLSVIQHMSERVGVMYLGKIVEMAKSDVMFRKPLHPYTEALFSAKPIPDPKIKRKRIVLGGEIGNSANLPSGCYLHPRCKYAHDICKDQTPKFRELEPERFVACHLAEDLHLRGMYVR